MSQITLKVSLESPDPSQAGLYAQELRNRILDEVQQGASVSLGREKAESQQFFETVIIDVAGAALVHMVLKVIEHYRRPPGMTLRIQKGGQVAVLSDVNPNAAKELERLREEEP
jgi:hypothetical protein